MTTPPTVVEALESLYFWFGLVTGIAFKDSAALVRSRLFGDQQRGSDA